MSRQSTSGGGARRAVASALLVTFAGCGVAPPEASDARGKATPTEPAGAIGAARARVGRFPAGRAREEHLPFEVLAIAGGRSALLVAQAAEQPVGFARRIDDQGRLGPVLRFAGEWVYRAFEAPDGGMTIVLADGRQVCVAALSAGEAAPSARGCRGGAPALAAPVGDRVAFFEVEVARPSEPTPPPTPTPRPARHAHVPKEPKKPAKAAPTRRAPKADVAVKVRFATRAGEFDAEAKPIGLTFKQPQEGLRLLDAQPRAGGVDILFYEWAPERASKSALGGARLVTAWMKPDGTLDKASRVAVTDGDLEYGYVRDRKGARLATTEAGSVLVAMDRKPECVVWRAQPKWSRLPTNPLLCSLDPARLARPDPPSQRELDALLKLEKLDPRRAFGQSKLDFGLVAWAGDRAVFVQNGGLATAPRDTGEPRQEPYPFVAHGAHLGWATFASDGEAVALVGDDVVHVDVAGEMELAPLDPHLPKGGVLRAEDEPLERRHAARIGHVWWQARGDGFRVFPAPAAVPLPPEADRADASALVGGDGGGLLVQVSGEGEIVALPIDAKGAAVAREPSAPAASPVRVGFAAASRAAGGAIVAGVSVGDPSRVVAFAIDAAGRVAAVYPTPLPIVAGDLAVRVEALPGGGAWLADASRAHVVWLDDDARPVAAGDWPAETSDAACTDGRPARSHVPSPAAGRFVRVPELAEAGTCVVGEPTWARDGTSRWFASHATGLDVTTELVITRPEVPLPAPEAALAAVAPLAGAAPIAGPRKRRACPLDMVLVAKKLCVDRFEDALVDATTLEPLSPDYAPTLSLEEAALGEWATGRERTGDVHARAMPLPTPPSLRGKRVEPLAVSRLGARPNGYVSGVVAERACNAAGKRLCNLDEFLLACRGEDDTLQPYGDAFQDGACNVNRDEHPASSLHDNPSIGHLDPRLDRVPSALGKPLYQATGQSPACRSRWGVDAAYDMVGNVDEWIEHGAGAFAGGFYSRNTKSGCEALVATHPRSYLDYSTGVRCCKDPEGADGRSATARARRAK